MSTFTPEKIFTSFNIDRSLYQVPIDPETNKPATEIIINPVYQKSNNFILDEINWSIIDYSSNFKNAVGYSTEASVEYMTGSNIKNVAFKVKNLQLGEVIFLKIQAIGITNQRDAQDNPIPNTEAHSIIAIGYSVICRGDPINTPFLIYRSNNGTLNNETVYDSPIEEQIYSIIERRDSEPFNTKLRTSNGGPNLFGEPFQTEKRSLKEQLAFFHNQSLQTPAGQFRKEYKNRGSSRSEIATIMNDGTNTLKTVHHQMSHGFSLPKIERAMYAHGRSLDVDSIDSLNHQNPGNFFPGENQSPDKNLYGLAVHNRRNQPQGHNRVIRPLLNPNLLPGHPRNKKLTGGKSLRAYFPGRSTHRGFGFATTRCGKQTWKLSGADLGYPACAGVGDNGFCGGETSVCVPICIETSMCCGDCSATFDKCYPLDNNDYIYASATLLDGSTACISVANYTFPGTQTYWTTTTTSTPNGNPTQNVVKKTTTLAGTAGFYANFPNSSLMTECECENNNMKRESNIDQVDYIN